MVASSDKSKLYTIGNKEIVRSKKIKAALKKIFQFSCPESMTNCKWTEIETKLKENRYFHVAFLISNELTQKICK